MAITVSDRRPAGYAYLMEKFALAGIPNWHSSSVSSGGTHRSNTRDGFVDEVFRAPYWPGEGVGEQLEFALKYDGVNLGLLAQIFEHISPEELTAYVKSKPTGKYARRIWFFYEFLTGRRLPIENISTGNYVDILEAPKYYTIKNGERSHRHRIVNNLLGPQSFCPIIRKTEKLSRDEASDLRERCEKVVAEYSPELLRRALSYLYNKETKSSFEIEHIKPDASRAEKFIRSLELAEREDFCEKQRLIELQNRIVGERFREHDYRGCQNYVGQSVAYQREVIHYICPKPDDLAGLMEGLIECHKRMRRGGVSPVIHAAAISYGFVFLHPFEDGNGRIHRFLIHNILALLGVVPNGLMFPVSAVILKKNAAYDASLESFSRPLMELVNYQLDGVGQMTVENDTAHLYRYIDMTIQAEALYDFVINTIEEELVDELSFLADYDRTKRAIQDVIDMPDRKTDLLMRFCLQNNGRLSETKRVRYFAFLSDDEIKRVEQAVITNFFVIK